MSFAEIYFGVVGVVLACTGIALLVNFRGLARRWESQVNALSAEVNRLARLPWPANPYVGPTFRPAAGIFAVLLGGVLVGLVLIGAIR